MSVDHVLGAEASKNGGDIKQIKRHDHLLEIGRIFASYCNNCDNNSMHEIF